MIGRKFVGRYWLPVFSGANSETQISIYYLGDHLDIYEIDGVWSRVSDFYSDQYGKKTARWVLTQALVDNRPSYQDVDFGPQLMDQRITGLPKVGEFAHSVEDLFLLRTLATNLLSNGECKAITFGGKRKDGDYFLECEGEESYRLFKKEDL